MLTIAIPQLYCGASGKKGAYNRQEVGLARAFAALGCRAVAIYPAVGETAPTVEELEPNVKALYLPARALAGHAFYKSWQPLLDEGVGAVHLMGDTSLGVPGLYRFCCRHHIRFYSQVGAVTSSANNPAIRFGMDLLARRNWRIYRKTPTYAKTPAVAARLAALGIPCAGVMPVGLDTAIIPTLPATPGSRETIRRSLGLDPAGHYLLFVGRLDAYKRPLDLPAVLAALPPDWQAVVIGQGALHDALFAAMQAKGLQGRWVCIPQLANTAVHAYYHACEVYVNFNDQEIFGMGLLEAMYAGCPPVARHAPGPDFIIEAGVSGLLVTDTADFAPAVLAAATNPTMGQAATRRVWQHFLWSTGAEMALDMLEKTGEGA
ncbi:MAG: glycosyltransferase family 4 protein [Gemmiger sp.]|nr:glycosyltransferase family 4 protein [Gemmiger sp.]